jgi:hypothetical protein
MNLKNRTISLATAVACVLSLGLAAPAAQATVKVASPSVAAANYLATQIRGDGTVRMSAGAPIQVGNTVQVAIALHAAGLRTSAVSKAASSLATWLAGRRKAKKLASIDVGSIAYLLLLTHNLGRDPHSFGGVDLSALLLAQQRSSSAAEAGLFGSADPSYDGVFRQSLALQGLIAAGVKTNAVTQGFDWLLAQQCPNGGFSSDVAANPCSGLPENWAGPDTNSSSLAIAALGTATRLWPDSGITVPASAWNFMRSSQTVSGGFGYFPGNDADSNSTAQAVIAIAASGQTATALGLVINGQSASDALSAFQRSGPAASRGYFFQAGSDPDLISTEQALLAAMGQALVR